MPSQSSWRIYDRINVRRRGGHFQGGRSDSSMPRPRTIGVDLNFGKFAGRRCLQKGLEVDSAGFLGPHSWIKLRRFLMNSGDWRRSKVHLQPFCKQRRRGRFPERFKVQRQIVERGHRTDSVSTAFGIVPPRRPEFDAIIDGEDGMRSASSGLS